ncbi:hypothetical protein [Absidia glauca]|uniref:Profilin n=1 Tax=Absidia glauca TaxID=4829 RepID=A0A168T3V4_ABSGL|nr:hypothetical protein [Absidia glauca]
MSWQEYVDNNLIGTNQVSQAAIYGLNGAVWASSAGFKMSQPEVTELIEGFSDSMKVQGTGFHVNGVKYLTLRADDRSIYGKKGSDGVCAVKTTQAVLVGVYKEGIQPGSCTKVVEGLADYLLGVGYPVLTSSHAILLLDGYVPVFVLFVLCDDSMGQRLVCVE